MTDLVFDSDDVGADLVVRCRIDQAPRRGDPAFAPMAGDTVLVDDGAGLPLRARVLASDDGVVTVQILEQHPLVIHALRRVLWAR